MRLNAFLLWFGLLGIAVAPAWANPAPATTASAAVAHIAALSPELANPYGLQALWAQGDWVAKGTLMLLLLMSVSSWGLMVNKLLEQRRYSHHAAQLVQADFWRAASLSDALARLAAGSPFRALAECGLAAAQAPPPWAQGVNKSDWVGVSVQRVALAQHSQLQAGLTWLATVGATAPFVGLFGTVWGIYNALVQIGVSGQASIDRVAGPVGEALIMTALGLAVAVPAVLGYNWLVRRNKLLLDQINAFAAEVQTLAPGAAHQP